MEPDAEYDVLLFQVPFEAISPDATVASSKRKHRATFALLVEPNESHERVLADVGAVLAAQLRRVAGLATSKAKSMSLYEVSAKSGGTEAASTDATLGPLTPADFHYISYKSWDHSLRTSLSTSTGGTALSRQAMQLLTSWHYDFANHAEEIEDVALRTANDQWMVARQRLGREMFAVLDKPTATLANVFDAFDGVHLLG